MRPSASSLSHPTRLLAASAAVLLLGAGLAGCGSAKSHALSKADARSALLSEANLGDGFKVDTSKDDGSKAPGCLKDLNAKTKAPTDESRDFNADNENGLPSVGSQVASYASDSAAKKAMSSARTAISKCTSVSYTADGASTTLTITNDDKTSVDHADEQLNIVANGTVTAQGQSFPIALAFSAVRVKNTVAIVTITDLAEDASKDLATYLKTAVDRVVAVEGGKTPDEAAVDVSHTLSAPEANTALMTAGNLGGTFKADSTADHTTASPGCLAAVDKVTDKTDAPVHAVADFTAGSKTGFPLISNTVESYDTVASAKAALEKFRTDIKACASVDATDQGTSTKLTVSEDETKTSPDTDEQVNIQAVGTIANSGGSSPLWLGLAVVRIGNNLTTISVGDLASKAPGDVSQLIQIIDDRLIAVMAGNQPSAAVAGS